MREVFSNRPLNLGTGPGGWRRRELLALALPAWMAGADNASAATSLTLATGAVPPLVSAPGRPGFVEELMREVFARSGVDIVLAPMSLERSLINANAGIEDGDLIHSAAFEKDYPNLVRVPEKIMDLEIVAFAVRPDVQARDWSELRRYSVGYISGWKMVEQSLKGARDLTAARDMDQLVQLLAHARADAVVVSRWQGVSRAARQIGLALRRLDPPLMRIPMYTYLHHRHAALVAAVAAALVEAKRDGTWQRLHDRILGPEEAAR